MRKSVALTTTPAAKAASRSAGSKPIDPVPEGEIRRRRLLRLQGHDPVDGLDNVESLPAQQELPAEGGPVELSRGESHGGSWHPTTGPGLGGPETRRPGLGDPASASALVGLGPDSPRSLSRALTVD